MCYSAKTRHEVKVKATDHLFIDILMCPIFKSLITERKKNEFSLFPSEATAVNNLNGVSSCKSNLHYIHI